MALSDATVETVRRMTGEPSFTAVKARVESLDEAQLPALTDYADRWEAVEPEHLKVQGGRDGIILNPDDDRAFLRRESRVMLGLPAYSDADLAADPNVLQLVEMHF
jgi:hypothetical protein